MQIKSIHKAVGLGCIWVTITATPAMAFDTISIRQNGHDNEINAAQFDNHIVGDNRLSIEQNGGLSVATRKQIAILPAVLLPLLTITTLIVVSAVVTRYR